MRTHKPNPEQYVSFPTDSSGKAGLMAGIILGLFALACAAGDSTPGSSTPSSTRAPLYSGKTPVPTPTLTKKELKALSDSKFKPKREAAPRTGSTSSRYIRGPRGGCYYINGNGNKTYVDRSLCD